MNTPTTPTARILAGGRVQVTLSTEDFNRLMGSETTEWWALKRRLEPVLVTAEAEQVCRQAVAR